MITPKELKALYPYQFEGRHIGLSFFMGWMPVFAQLCADIDAALGPDKRNFRWVQLKQKFGSARFYGQMDSPFGPDEDEDNPTRLSVDESNNRYRRLADPDEAALRKRIQALRLNAQSRTEETCIVCGEPGEIDRSTGSFLVVCPEHARQRRRGDMEPAWFSEVDEGP